MLWLNLVFVERTGTDILHGSSSLSALVDRHNASSGESTRVGNRWTHGAVNIVQRVRRIKSVTKNDIKDV